ncbi:hypothetical protein N7520_010287 [Penicillium odoratum]|uniref:uncharacterized protein n=1 Tax=Penicillium odoratum TaxID=1167516 RepID=UPI002547369A|nr:uncharacterized protein N7520_010287 [Penicillium odoratum]KAJ5745105.1 hypothetical protein N7520_010287 [Penicillium odoratum]
MSGSVLLKSEFGSGIHNDSAGIGYLNMEDDDSDNELWLVLSRPLNSMKSFEIKDLEDET